LCLQFLSQLLYKYCLPQTYFALRSMLQRVWRM